MRFRLVNPTLTLKWTSLPHVSRLLWLLHRDSSFGHHMFRPLNWKAELKVELWHPHFKHSRKIAKKNGQKSRTPGRPFCSLPLPELWSRSVDLCETQGFLPNAELSFILFPCLDWSAEKALFAVLSSWSKLQTSWKPLIFLLTTCVFLEKSVTVNEATSCRGPNGPRDDAQFRAWQCWNLKAKKDAHCVTKTRNEMVMK